MNTPSPWLRLAPVLFLLLWSGGFSFAKLGLAHAEPMTFLALRYALVLAVLAPIYVLLRPDWPRRRADWGHLALVGLLIQAVYFGASYMAFTLGMSAGGTALIVSLQPILVALLAPWLAHERVGGMRWLGMALGLTGAALVILARWAVEVTALWGVVAALVALLSMTAATLYQKRFGVALHPVNASLIQYTVGLAAILPVALWLEDTTVHWDLELLIALAYLVVGNSLISITLLLLMLRHGEASRVSALFFLIPPVAALIAWGILGEVLPPPAWAGMVVAALGVAIVSRH